MTRRTDYKKIELSVGIIYSLMTIGLLFYLMNYLLWLKIVVGILYAVFSWWVGHFLRKKKKEAEAAEFAAENEG